MSRGLPTKDFSGTLVEHFLISAELLIRDERQIRALGQVVADATVLAFAGTALPRTVRVAEEDLQVEIGGEQLGLGHLRALVVGEGFADDNRASRLTLRRPSQPDWDDRLGVTGALSRFQLDAFFHIQMGIGPRSPLRARRDGGSSGLILQESMASLYRVLWFR